MLLCFLSVAHVQVGKIRKKGATKLNVTMSHNIIQIKKTYYGDDDDNRENCHFAEGKN